MAKKYTSKKKCCPCPKKAMRKTRKTRKSPKSKGKNQFFTLMLKAKKNNSPAFTYNGKKYKRTTTKNGLIFYKKA